MAAAEDVAILAVLERQRRAGMDVLTDGEFRRAAWQTDLADAVGGFRRDFIPMAWYGPDGAEAGESSALIVDSPLCQTRRVTAHESRFLMEHAGGPWKMTLPSAATFGDASFNPGVTDQVSPTRRDLLAAIAPILREEMNALVADGAHALVLLLD